MITSAINVISVIMTFMSFEQTPNGGRRKWDQHCRLWEPQVTGHAPQLLWWWVTKHRGSLGKSESWNVSFHLQLNTGWLHFLGSCQSSAVWYMHCTLLFYVWLYYILLSAWYVLYVWLYVCTYHFTSNLDHGITWPPLRCRWVWCSSQFTNKRLSVLCLIGINCITCF